MTETEGTTGVLLDMLSAHTLHAEKYELPVIGQALNRIRMGVPSVKVEALFRRELALSRAKPRNGNVVTGPSAAGGGALPIRPRFATSSSVRSRRCGATTV